MSVISEQELVYGSYIAGNNIILEPVLKINKIPFLATQVLRPDLFREGILQLNQVLIAHPGVNFEGFYDPVVSVTENYVDFDGFAQFAHSYCKIRFPTKLFKERIQQEGTTNVDFNPNFIKDLRDRWHTRNLWLYIDPDGVELAVDNKSHYLERIRMPTWWRDAYQQLNKYVNIETLELHDSGKFSGQFNKVILSGMAFQQLIDEISYSYLVPRNGVRSLLWSGKTVDLALTRTSSKESKSITSVKLLTPCQKSIKSWGVWRILNLSGIARYIIQADVYLAEKQPNFWILHANSGVKLLLGFTPYTNALWTEKARKEVENLLKSLVNQNASLRRRRRRKYKPRNKPKSRINYVSEHPGQRIILDFILN